MPRVDFCQIAWVNDIAIKLMVKLRYVSFSEHRFPSGLQRVVLKLPLLQEDFQIGGIDDFCLVEKSLTSFKHN